MAKIKAKGIEQYSKALAQLEMRARTEVCGAALYGGADILADAVRSALEEVPTDTGYGTPDHPLDGPNPAQKAALLDSFGVTPMWDDMGVLDIKVGFEGYNGIRTKRWPKGQPNAMVARSIERGTSFMAAHPVIKKAVASVRKRVLVTMQKSLEMSLDKILK